MENFKYPIISLFFDADEVACTFTEEVILLYPEYSKAFNRKSWDIDEVSVIAIADVENIKLHKLKA